MPRWSLLFITAFCALADTYPRQPGIDALHYVFRVTLGDSSDEITGDASADIRFLEDGVREFSLDLGQGMTVTAVTEGDQALQYRHQNDRLAITLLTPAKTSEKRQFRIRYHGTPASGLYFSKNKHGQRGIFSLNWPNLAHEWLPLVDHPGDKATSEFLITAPQKYQVVANGLLQEETDLGDGRRLAHWQQSVPISSWLNAIGVAQFARRDFGVAAGVPLQSWVPYQERDSGIATFEWPTRQAMEFLSSHVGAFPYEKLANVWATVPGFGGGTEHASVIFYSCCQTSARVVWHEIAHQWFGDSVTEKDWDDVWLSEGFATYFTHLIGENADGRDAFVKGLDRDRLRIFQAEKSNPGATVVHHNATMKKVLDPGVITYQKGSWVLHMLRGQIGTERFWAGIREYYRRYRDSNASTDDFRKVMEEVSGEDLGWFFAQWLHRTDSPVVQLAWKYNAQNHQVEIDASQTQAGEAYRLRIDLAIAGEIKQIEMTGKTQHFGIAAAQAPEKIVADPDTWLLVDFRSTAN